MYFVVSSTKSSAHISGVVKKYNFNVTSTFELYTCKLQVQLLSFVCFTDVLYIFYILQRIFVDWVGLGWVVLQFVVNNSLVVFINFL